MYSSIDFVPPYISNSDLIDLRRFQEVNDSHIIYEICAPAPRKGAGVNPWNIQLPNDYLMPDLSIATSSVDFSTASDLRAQQVSELIEKTNLPIVCHWSGGIDSTVVLAALIKNLKKTHLKDVIVAMSVESYFENPLFFENVIKKHQLKYTTLAPDWNQALILTGQPADAIWIQADILEINRFSPGCWKKNPMTDPDLLISWFTKKSNTGLANWFYQTIAENSISAGVELFTYEDFYWWANFNYYYSAQCIKNHDYSVLSPISDIASYDNFRQNSIPWFNTCEYQNWSIFNRSNGIKFDGSIENYKKPAKDYIFELDKNPYYHRYKTKTGSGRFNSRYPLMALYNNGTAIY